ncbi:aldo/keto reductase [Sphingobacterium paludis]|uniref:Diketogulonate reductase-like aldo/keto reductase n=1 Tax=Sphingobacterium paludis TaxID=1476465 RepID=A0A4R7CUL8_9SPHI|nr:aldo/keto reductase [Sphingobacterium paludis]TDS07519.1 diketogulonate reductase-like aldo/keto reductase [Sphingobacterium paludis]
MQQIQLNDGQRIPVLGFGTYKATNEEGVAAVLHALKLGYRLFDTAAKYGNEEQVGAAIKQSGIPREEIKVTTKLWRENLGYAQTKEAVQVSLGKLGMDYIDVYLIHWPANAKNYTNWRQANADAWRAMEELQAAGKIKTIGVSNFWPEHLDALLETARVPPAINQIEFHPGYWQPEVLAYCQSKGIAVESWSPLARGKVFGNPLLEALAQRHGKSVSQVCLRWVIQHDVTVIPKSTSADRIAENLDIFNFELSADEMSQIDHLPEMGFSGELPNNWPDRV